MFNIFAFILPAYLQEHDERFEEISKKLTVWRLKRICHMICVGVLRQLQTFFLWINDNTLGNFNPLFKKCNIQVPDSERWRYLRYNALSECAPFILAEI